MWSGKFEPIASGSQSSSVLQIGPKDKRKQRDDDVDQRKAVKRVELDESMKKLSDVDRLLINYFDYQFDADVDALNSLEKYRFDALVEYRSKLPVYESVTQFMARSGYNPLVGEIAKVFGFPLAELVPALMTNEYRRRSPQYANLRPDGSYTVGNSDFETFFQLLIRPAMKRLAARNVPSWIDMVVGMLALVLARFEATDSIKSIIEKIARRRRGVDPFDDLVRPYLVSDLFVELSKLNVAKNYSIFSIESHISHVADIVKIRILSFLDQQAFVAYCKTEKTLQEKCESGVWKNNIADLRFERQFGKDASDVLGLRYRFYPPNISKRRFQYAAIRAAKFLAQNYNSRSEPVMDVTKISLHFRTKENEEDIQPREELAVFMWLLWQKNPVFADIIVEYLIKSTSLLENIIDSNGLLYDGKDAFDRIVEFQEDWFFTILNSFSLEALKKIYKKHETNSGWAEKAATFSDVDIYVQYNYLYVCNELLDNDSTDERRRAEITANLITQLDSIEINKQTRELITNKGFWNAFVRSKLNFVDNSWDKEFQIVTVILSLHCADELDADIKEMALQKVVQDFVDENDDIFKFDAEKYYEICGNFDLWYTIILALSRTDKLENDTFRSTTVIMLMKLMAQVEDVETKRVLTDLVNKWITQKNTYAYYRRTVTLEMLIDIYPDGSFWLQLLRKLYQSRPITEVVNAFVHLDSKTTLDSDVRMFFARIVLKDQYAAELKNWARDVLGLPRLAAVTNLDQDILGFQ